MDAAKDTDTIVYPFSLDREGFLKWFRENFYNLKQNPEANNYIKIYYKCLSAAEKSNDMIIDSIRYLRKSNERDKEIANYKNIIDSYKNKNSNLEKANNQLKNILAYMRCSVRDDIEKTHSICKTKSGKQAKSLRNAYQVMLANVNNKTVDINTNLNFFLNEMNLILDDKWITEFFEQYKNWACNNIDNLYKKLDEETLRDINLYKEKINQKMSISKTSIRSADISGHGDNNASDGVFKKPVDLPPVKSLKKISIIETKESENDTDPFKITSRQSVKKDFIYNIPQVDSQPKKSENRSNVVDAQKGSSESALGANKEVASDDKQGNLSSIMEVTEPSSDESAHHPTPPILSLSLAIDQIEKDSNDFFKSCKPVAESTVKPNKSTQEIEKVEIDYAIDMDYFQKKGPVAESTKKPAPFPQDNNNHRNIVDSFHLQDIQTLRPMAESTKKVPENKLGPLDESLSITVLNKCGPVAESTKKVDSKSAANQDEVEANPKSMKQSSKEIKISQRSSTESEYPVKKLQEKKSELLDESLTMTTFKKLAPVAESTKKKDINSNNKLIVREEEIEINQEKPIDFAIDMEYFLKKGPVAESTKKVGDPIGSDSQLSLSDLIKSRPVAESTKKVQGETVETIQLKSLPLTDVNKCSQIPKLEKLSKENTRLLSTNKDYDNNEEKENLSENNVECTKMNLNPNSEDLFNKTQFFITENKILISDNLKVFPKSPWEPEIRSQLWEKCLQVLKYYPDVYIIDQEISLRNKITFKTGDQYNDFYLSSASKLKSDKFVDVFVTGQSGGTGRYVVKILNSKESIEYYVIKYIHDLINKKPSKIVDIAPSICSVFNLLLTSSKSVILMPYYNKGSLLDLSMMIKKENIKMSDAELIVAFIAIELLLTVFYLHNTAHILHCDIKPDNIMLNEYFPTLVNGFQLTKTRVITIIDFGKAIFLNHFGSYSAFVARGSPKGLECVEMVANKPWRYQIDLFNIATTLYILLQSRYPHVVQKENHYAFSSFSNFRNLRVGSLWLDLFDKLINIESDNYPQINGFLKGFTDLINSNINEYNRVADSVNKLLRMQAPL